MTTAYAKTYRVASYDVGPNSKLTLPALLRSLHDVAQQHAGSVGFGYRDLLPREFAWALVTIELSIKDRPSGEAEMKLATSVARSGGPLVFRDYLGESNGNAFVVGQSLWALIDLKTRRTTRLPIDLQNKLAEIQDPLQSEIARVKRFGSKSPLPIKDQRQVRAHDCDFNGHLNNVVTARWMLDAAFEHAPNLSNDIASLKLSYHQEALLGEMLTVGLAIVDRTASIELRRQDGVLIVSGKFA
ncbi:MAG: acyl-[acyl-carrier-protein] thioesterase [Saprospiraceae bacterium]